MLSDPPGFWVASEALGGCFGFLQGLPYAFRICLGLWGFRTLGV